MIADEKKSFNEKHVKTKEERTIKLLLLQLLAPLGPEKILPTMCFNGRREKKYVLIKLKGRSKE